MRQHDWEDKTEAVFICEVGRYVSCPCFVSLITVPNFITQSAMPIYSLSGCVLVSRHSAVAVCEKDQRLSQSCLEVFVWIEAWTRAWFKGLEILF